MITRNIILLPPPQVMQQAISWSKRIASDYKTNFILDAKKFYPHITLYQAALPDKNLPIVEEKLVTLVKQMKPFSVHADDFSTLVGFVFLTFVKSEALLSAHEQIVKICNPLREGENIPAEVQNLTDPTVPEFIKQSIRTYGSALAMEAYVPHITLSRLQNLSDAEKARAKLEKAEISFDVHSIHVANIGPDGTVNEMYREFPFRMI